MNRIGQTFVVFLLGGLPSGCSMPADRAAAAIESGRSANATLAFLEVLDESGVVAFRSTSDSIADCGTQFAFLPGNRFEMQDLGYARTRYSGSFELSEHGVLRVILEDANVSWVTMVLDQRDGQMLLWPYEAGFACGMPEMPSDYEESYWPYQQLNDEAVNLVQDLLVGDRSAA